MSPDGEWKGLGPRGEGKDFDLNTMEEEVVIVDTKNKLVDGLAILMCVFVTRRVAPLMTKHPPTRSTTT